MTKLIPSLNGLRAISILLVVFSHVAYRNFGVPDAPGGQLGVNIFFVISGFLITLLLLKEEANTGTVSLRNFFTRRCLRIFPVFYFLLLVYFILQCAGILTLSSISWISSLTYTKYFFITQHPDWETGHLWSLSVEEHFYLIWPVVFIYLKNYRRWFAIAIILIVPIVRLLSDIPILHLFTRADALMWGCLVALNYEKVKVYILSKPKGIVFIPFIMLAICLLVKKIPQFDDANGKSHVMAAFLGSYGMITDICICLIMVISINYQNNIYFKFLNWAPIDYIGKLSYGIYIWQQLFLSNHVGILSKLPINLICILGVSMFSFYCIEKPFINLKDRFTKKQPLKLSSL